MARPTRRSVASWTATAGVIALMWLFVWPAAFGGSMSYVTVKGPSMEPIYTNGDFVAARASATYEVGDVVVFTTTSGNVIHRIIGGDGANGYVTEGDNTDSVDPWSPTDEEVLGAALWHIPGAGKAIETVRDTVLTPPFPYLLAGLVFLTIVLGDDKARKRRNDHADDAGDPAAAKQPDVESPSSTPR